eukprot:3941189-Rhodomonas_salina.1
MKERGTKEIANGSQNQKVRIEKAEEMRNAIVSSGRGDTDFVKNVNEYWDGIVDRLKDNEKAKDAYSELMKWVDVREKFVIDADLVKNNAAELQGYIGGNKPISEFSREALNRMNTKLDAFLHNATQLTYIFDDAMEINSNKLETLKKLKPIKDFARYWDEAQKMLAAARSPPGGGGDRTKEKKKGLSIIVDDDYEAEGSVGSGGDAGSSDDGSELREEMLPFSEKRVKELFGSHNTALNIGAQLKKVDRAVLSSLSPVKKYYTNLSYKEPTDDKKRDKNNIDTLNKFLLRSEITVIQELGNAHAINQLFQRYGGNSESFGALLSGKEVKNIYNVLWDQLELYIVSLGQMKTTLGAIFIDENGESERDSQIQNLLQRHNGTNPVKSNIENILRILQNALLERVEAKVMLYNDLFLRGLALQRNLSNLASRSKENRTEATRMVVNARKIVNLPPKLNADLERLRTTAKEKVDNINVLHRQVEGSPRVTQDDVVEYLDSPVVLSVEIPKVLKYLGVHEGFKSFAAKSYDSSDSESSSPVENPGRKPILPP